MPHRLTELTSPAQLRTWYEDELMSENEIAHRLNTYQVNVGRLRKKWGIPTLSQADRALRLRPSLTPFQEQLVVGSLLGDGWMAATSVLSARFQDGHCIQQAAYTDWKAHLMKPFTSNLRDGAKRENGKVFHSHSFSTTSCPQLRPFYDLFYPAPARMRVFPASLSMLMTSLTLAVWYMDDGNVTAHGMPRIAFGLDDLSLQRAHKALVRLGLKPVCYGEGGDRAIHFPKQSMLFRELVGSHVPDCMQYKLPFESVGQAQHRQARQLAPEQARALYEGGMSVPLIASVYQVGESTVSRRLKTARVAKRSSGPRKSGHTV